MDDVVHCYYRPNYSEIGIRPAKAACTPNFFRLYVRTSTCLSLSKTLPVAICNVDLREKSTPGLVRPMSDTQQS